MVNVYNEDDTKVVSEVDGTDLFYDFQLNDKEVSELENNDGLEVAGRFKIKLSKGGALQTESSSKTKKVTITQANDFYETKMEDIETGITTAVKLTAAGEIEFTDAEGSHTLSSILSRLSALEGN